MKKNELASENAFHQKNYRISFQNLELLQISALGSSTAGRRDLGVLGIAVELAAGGRSIVLGTRLIHSLAAYKGLSTSSMTSRVVGGHHRSFINLEKIIRPSIEIMSDRKALQSTMRWKDTSAHLAATFQGR
ncbi:hypothetical protein EVAR_87514_1 [Eumeta japonica]|uniref:Uncharacterized protein n=1 Tax=Eumeta variegata TaxID=151549 RepID=A0A4C1XPW5_EUMVA|nr:hypothetical protein EVAR_87514_1 [Eumeta japonica]